MRRSMPGLGLQILALSLLAALDPAWPLFWSVVYASSVQGPRRDRQGPHQDELQVGDQADRPGDAKGALFKWVAILTGSKNAMKGAGFFLGGLLLGDHRLSASLLLIAACLVVILAGTLFSLAARHGPGEDEAADDARSSPSRWRSTGSPSPGSSSSGPGTSGSSSPCRSFSTRSRAGTSSRSRRSSPFG
jgi:hypothetical protein